MSGFILCLVETTFVSLTYLLIILKKLWRCCCKKKKSKKKKNRRKHGQHIEMSDSVPHVELELEQQEQYSQSTESERS